MDKWSMQIPPLKMFRAVIEKQCDYQCMAMQNAIDRLLGAFDDGRAGFFKRVKTWESWNFITFLESSNPKDLEKVTSKSKKAWIEWTEKCIEEEYEAQRNTRETTNTDGRTA